jgi:hypothetical protein
MTHEELDAMWSIATCKSIEENQPYTRYEFAKMVAAKEREACAKVCIELAPSIKTTTAYKVLHEASKDILARGQA